MSGSCCFRQRSDPTAATKCDSAAVSLAGTITTQSNLATKRLCVNSVIHIIKPLALQQQNSATYILVYIATKFTHTEKHIYQVARLNVTS